MTPAPSTIVDSFGLGPINVGYSRVDPASPASPELSPIPTNAGPNSLFFLSPELGCGVNVDPPVVFVAPDPDPEEPDPDPDPDPEDPDPEDPDPEDPDPEEPAVPTPVCGASGCSVSVYPVD
jgi:hypothetical protein